MRTWRQHLGVWVGIFTLFGVCSAVLGWEFGRHSISIPQSKAQVLLYIPALIAFYLFLKPTVLFSKKIFLGAFIIVLCATGFAYSSLTLKSQAIFFAPLAEDPSGAETRIVRLAFLKLLQKTADTVSVSPLYESVGSHQDAADIIDNRSHVRGIFWGSTRILSLTFQETISVQTIPYRPWNSALKDIKVITQIPYLDTPFYPLDETLKVLAAAFSDDEITLADAGTTVGRWRTSSQRGYIFFKLGTKQLLEGLSGMQYQYAALDCAEDSLRTALKFSVGAENDLLRRAVISNLSVLSLARGMYEASPFSLREARNLALRAARTLNANVEKNSRALIDSIAVQRNNSDVLREIR